MLSHFDPVTEHICDVTTGIATSSRVTGSLSLLGGSVLLFLITMSSQKACISSVNVGAIFSAMCLLVYFAGFIRIEVKWNDHEQRLREIEDRLASGLASVRQGLSEAPKWGKYCLGLSRFFSHVLVNDFEYEKVNSQRSNDQ
mgnify:CR=1 FL=1